MFAAEAGAAYPPPTPTFTSPPTRTLTNPSTAGIPLLRNGNEPAIEQTRVDNTKISDLVGVLCRGGRVMIWVVSKVVIESAGQSK